MLWQKLHPLFWGAFSSDVLPSPACFVTACLLAGMATALVTMTFLVIFLFSAIMADYNAPRYKKRCDVIVERLYS